GALRAAERGPAVLVVLEARQPVAVTDRGEERGQVLAGQIDVVIADGDAEELGPQEVGVHARDSARSARRARRSSAWRASVSRSSWPCITCSLSGTVTFTRWSVTRFCGKLYVRTFSARSPEPSWERRAAVSSACCSSRARS